MEALLRSNPSVNGWKFKYIKISVHKALSLLHNISKCGNDVKNIITGVALCSGCWSQTQWRGSQVSGNRATAALKNFHKVFSDSNI